MSHERTSRAILHSIAASLGWTLRELRYGGLTEIPRFAAVPEVEIAPEAEVAPSPEPGTGDGPEPERSPVASTASATEERSHGGRETLSLISEDLGDCRRCRLHAERRHLVFADGSETARLVFVGEGPGFEEDQQGLPFVGRAGRLLDKMIASLGLRRRDVYICNVVKCRPPKNRTPDPEEIEACSPFLFRQIESIQPDVVCALGACAAQTLLNTSSAISKLRGKVHLWRGIRLVCTYHPAYLLRNPASKAATWRDLLEIRRILDATRRV